MQNPITFVFDIEEVSLARRPVVLVGRIRAGEIHVGDKIRVERSDGTEEWVTLVGIEPSFEHRHWRVTSRGANVDDPPRVIGAGVVRRPNARERWVASDILATAASSD